MKRKVVPDAVLGLFLIIMLSVAFCPIPAEAGLEGVEVSFGGDGLAYYEFDEVQASLTQTPKEVHSWQPVLVFSHVVGNYNKVDLNVTVSVNATLKKDNEIIWSNPSSYTYSMTMLPISWALGWYMAGIPGLPAGTWHFEQEPSTDHIVINEVELNPAGDDYGNEWVELYNPTDSSIDISGWTISTTHGITVTVTIPSGTIMPPKSYYIVTYRTQWLDNELESVILRDAYGNEVDATPTLSDTFNDDRSWQRYPNGQDTNAITDWHFRPSTKGTTNGGITTIALQISSTVNYTLLVDGNYVLEDSYMVFGGEVEKSLPPLVITTVYDALRNPSILNDTLGLGPEGWVVGSGEIVKALIVAFDDKGFEGITNLTFEYKVDEGPWIQTSVNEDPLMRNLTNLVGTINSLIQSVEDKVRTINPSFDIPNIPLPCIIGSVEIPAQNAGVYVMFRANVTDVDENMFSSPTGLYYVVNRTSPIRMLIVDPHVKLWLLQENVRHLVKTAIQNSDYHIPEEIVSSSKIFSKISDVVKRYGIEAFHHWEKLGKYYDLHIAWPDEGLVNLLKSRAEGGYEPHVIILSDLWLGFNRSSKADYWDWDLRDIKADDGTVLEHLVNYVKERHAGLIATHGTLSDEVVWASCNPEEHYKVGARGHVGYSPADIDILKEKTIAALLGIPELAIWEYLRDLVAKSLCVEPETRPVGLAIGSMPLQVPNIPWNGTLRATPEARYLGWSIPEEMTITIPSVYNELGFRASTQVGWQLGLPRTIAHVAWRGVEGSRPLIKQLYGRLSMLIENATLRTVVSQVVSGSVDKAARYGLRNFDKSIISAEITGSVFNLTISIPELNKNISIDLGRRFYEAVLQKLPVKVIALSPNATAGIIVHDKYWDPDGYRSVYFSFEVEAAEGDVAETLLVNAVNWTLKWQYRNVTDLLGGLVRVPKDIANKFNETLAKLPGNLVLSEGLILNEEGFSKMKINVAGAGVFHILAAHPTTDKIEADVEGPATIVNITSEYRRVTRITLNVSGAGKVTIGLRARSDAALNPAYVSAKQETLGKAEFEVSQLTISPPEAKVGEEVNISVVVKNVGDARGIYTVTLKINGTLIGREDVTLAPNESTIVMFTVVEDEPGIYIVEVNGLTGEFRALRPPTFIVSDLKVEPKEVNVGDKVTVSINVKNVGDLGGTYTMVLKVNGTVVETKDITLNAHKSTLVAFTTSRNKPGKYVIEVDGLTEYFVVKPPTPPANFVVGGLTISKTRVEPGEKVVVSVNVKNVGGHKGSYTAELKLNGTVVKSKTVTLAPGESTTVTFELSVEEAGTYTVGVDDLSKNIEVVTPPSPTGALLLYVGALGIVIVIALVVFLRRRMK